MASFVLFGLALPFIEVLNYSIAESKIVDSKFLSFDQTAWAAIGTFVALGIALIGIFQKEIQSTWRRPKLAFEYGRFPEFSELIDGRFWIRVPIGNARRKEPAEKIEVFLESLTIVACETLQTLPRFFPIRIRWTHSNSPVCDRISSGAYRLLDFGCLIFQQDGKFVNAVMPINEPSTNFTFCLEIQPKIRHDIPVGTFRADLLICSASSKPLRESINITIEESRGKIKSDPERFISIQKF